MKNKKVFAAVLGVISVLLIVFSCSKQALLIGKWTGHHPVAASIAFDLFGNGKVSIGADGDESDSQTFKYSPDGNTMIVTQDGETSQGLYHLSGNTLAIDGLELKREAPLSFAAILRIISVILVLLALILFPSNGKPEINRVRDVINSLDKNKEKDERPPLTPPVITEDPPAPPPVAEEKEPAPMPENDAPPGRLKNTFPPKSDDDGFTSSSDEITGDWFKSAGDL